MGLIKLDNLKKIYKEMLDSLVSTRDKLNAINSNNMLSEEGKAAQREKVCTDSDYEALRTSALFELDKVKEALATLTTREAVDYFKDTEKLNNLLAVCTLLKNSYVDGLGESVSSAITELYQDSQFALYCLQMAAAEGGVNITVPMDRFTKLFKGIEGMRMQLRNELTPNLMGLHTDVLILSVSSSIDYLEKQS